MRQPPPYRAPGADPAPPDTTPVALTYGPFTLRKTDLGAWTLDVPTSFTRDDLSKLQSLAAWASQTEAYRLVESDHVLSGGLPFG